MATRLEYTKAVPQTQARIPKWSIFAATKAAASHWHHLANIVSVWELQAQYEKSVQSDSLIPEQAKMNLDIHTFQTFWKGLYKMSYHKTSNEAKFVPDFEDMMKVEVHVRGVREWFVDQIQKKDPKFASTPSFASKICLIRTFTMQVIGFFGIRRQAEVRAPQFEDLSWLVDGARWTIPSSKNDSLGLGKTCFLPFIPGGKLCPGRLLKEWLAFRQIQLGRKLKVGDLIFQCTGKNQKQLTIVSDSIFRRSLVAMFKV